jgi:hypothetical protein
VTDLIKSTFATNRADRGETVAAAISGHLEWLDATWKKPFRVSIATAYLNPGGFLLIEEALKKVSAVRLLVGAEPEPPLAQLRPINDEDGPMRRALDGYQRTIEQDRDLLGFTSEADASARRLVAWLRTESVEVRRLENGFLHGKAYLVDTDDEGVIAGSSNFTHAGLARNRELNLGHYDPKDVEPVREWFDELWEEAKPYDLASVFDARFEAHSPYLIYLRMLYEKYGADVEALAKGDPFGLHLATFQADGVRLAERILSRYSGVVVADGVGLGKTFLAGELIRQAVEDRRQRVLVIAPAALRDGPWAGFLSRHLFNFEIVSFDELAMDQQLMPDRPQSRPVLRHDRNGYALVVVDEAHAFRSPSTVRAEALNRLLEGTPAKGLILLTATPVNNSLWDLYNLLAYFVRNDAEFAATGTPSLRERFKEASAMDPDALDPSYLFDVLSPVVVRRTRSYVKHYYPDAEVEIDGVKKRITFPKAEVRPVIYDISSVLPGFLDDFALALDVPSNDPTEGSEGAGLSASERRAAGEEVLTLARYAPSAYRLQGKGAEAYERQVAGLLRSGLLKRFESSAHAFANTCETMATSHDAFLAVLDQGWVATGEALVELAASDTDELEELVANRDEKWNATPAGEYDIDRLRLDVENDRELLRSWAARARSVTFATDPKLAALVAELRLIIDEAASDVGEDSSERDRRKVIVFSYFADTAKWIHAYLEQAVHEVPSLAPFANRLVLVTGSDSESEHRRALFGFAPITTEAPPGQDDLFDVMVTTDVLAEGVNLQQARHIVNYDLPWNPMRLVQRHGRIDRIGSPHTRVWVRCFMPDAELDELLHLEARLHRKITQAAQAVGVEGTIIPGSTVADRVYTEAREVIDEIRAGDTAFLDDAARGRSVEEYRQQLRQGLESPYVAGQLKRLAWGSGTGKQVRGADRGFVFCARVGDSSELQFRYVTLDDQERPIILGDVLSCLRHAESATDTERVLNEATHAMAYVAWAAARQNILESWMWATDPRNLAPEVPRVMREAAELIRKFPPPGIDQSAADRLYDVLNAPYAERVRRQVREVLQSEDSPEERSSTLADLVERLALTPPTLPAPLPIIEEDDIHLVCWMAIVPS